MSSALFDDAASRSSLLECTRGRSVGCGAALRHISWVFHCLVLVPATEQTRHKTVANSRCTAGFQGLYFVMMRVGSQ
jgi:hypothetical protein